MSEAPLIPEPDPPPISAAEALRLVDIMIRIAAIYTGRGKQAQVEHTRALWLRQIRPFVAEAAARSNDE